MSTTRTLAGMLMVATSPLPKSSTGVEPLLPDCSPVTSCEGWTRTAVK